MTLGAGQRLSCYEILGPLGAGAMGEVYRARDTRLDRDVALKVLPAELADEPERLARFEREAKVLASLQHPNIVTVHSIEHVDGVRFLAMELVEGKTLEELIARPGLPLARFYKLALALADALHAAHGKGITHRDLKPANIVVDGSGRPKVLDFGIAKLQQPEVPDGEPSPALTETGRALGTLPYMAPEALRGEAVDCRADIFSLGIVLYELLTGEHPFPATDAGERMSAILRDPPAPLSDHRSDLPTDLARVLRRCLEKDPDRRMQTALDLRIEFEDLQGEVAEGQDVGGGVSARPGGRLRPAILGAAVLIVAAVATNAWLRTEDAAPTYVPRPLTGSLGWDSYPNWSPESEFIAFARVSAGSFDIVVKPVAGGEEIVRAGSLFDETAPRWSPDGTSLAYVSSEPGSPVFLVPPHGGAARKLIETGIPRHDTHSLSRALGDRPWSPDGRSLLVSRLTGSGQMAIFRVDCANGRAKQLSFPPEGGDDLSATLSFDGERIAFQRGQVGIGGLWTMPASGGDAQVLLADEFDYSQPAWRPDNRRIVFGSGKQESFQDLWEIDITTGLQTQLTFETKHIWAVTVSADDRIAHAPFWHDTFLFTRDVATGAERQLTSHNMDNFGARLSPDGKVVAYHSTRTGSCEVWLHPMDGAPEIPIAHNQGWNLYPDWSPDGRRLVFVSNREGPYNLFIVNRDGGGLRKLTEQAVSLWGNGFPVNGALVVRWSPDGERIAYVVSAVGGNALWAIRLDGTGARELVQGVRGFDWYRDSRHMLYTPYTHGQGGGEELVAVDLDSGREELLYEGPHSELAVAPDGRAVTFCTGVGHMSMGLGILTLEPPADPEGLPRAQGDMEELIVTEKNWHIHNGGWSADSKSLVFTRDIDHGDIYELVEVR